MADFIPTVLAPTLRGREKTLLQECFAAQSLAVITDPNTFAALGRRLLAALPPANTKHVVFDASPSATFEQVEFLRAKTHDCDALVAVGSGTLNDLCKYAAFLDKKPYAVFATAPSMNGYVSATASLSGGQAGPLKQSYAAAPPVAVFCDLETLAAAPARLIRSGLGDSLCRSTAQADWLLSHLLLGTPYDTRPFELLAPYEAQLFERSGELVSGNIKAVELLMRTLLASGEGMRLAGGSYPASQGEHMLAHTMETFSGEAMRSTYHGEQIGVTTLTMAALQERLLNAPEPPRVRHCHDETLMRLPEPEPGASPLAYLNDRLARHWNDWRGEIARVTLPHAYLANVLRRAGAPCDIVALGWSEDTYKRALTLASAMRNRFTFLNL